MSYQLLYQSDSVLRLADGATIPPATDNRDWQDYQAWLGLGNTPLPAIEPTPEELAAIEAARAAPGEARSWFNANPQAEGMFLLSVAQIEAEIGTRVDALFPAATAGNKTFMKLLLMALVVCIRVLVKREQLSN